MREIGRALRVSAATLILTGLLYPLTMTGLAQVVFPLRANGSLVKDGSGLVVGSELIAQRFDTPAYFHPRPSAAGEKGWDASASSGSNLGPTSAKLRDRVAAEAGRLEKENPQAEGSIPAELVTASGSGLDPHLSPEAARWQAPRVANARGIPLQELQALVAATREGRFLGVLGEPRVNVLKLNLELDRRYRSGVSRAN